MLWRKMEPSSNSSLVNKREGHCHGPKHSRRLSNANFFEFLEPFSLFSISMLWRKMELSSIQAFPFSPILIQSNMYAFSLLKMKIELALSFVNFGNCNHSMID
jgi:hypothetical protein